MKRGTKFFCTVFTVTTSLIATLAMESALGNQLYVTATELNGRSQPNKHSSIECRFSRGDTVETTGVISNDGGWVEVIGGETGTVWCSADYLSETRDSAKYVNTSGGRVRLRKTPEGKFVGWVQTNEQITVARIVNGWGYIKDKGWVDLQYFYQVL